MIGRRARDGVDALPRLAGGLGTAVLALVGAVSVLVCLVACLVGIGLLLLPTLGRGLRAVADRERARLSPDGLRLPPGGPVPGTARQVLADVTLRRELAWAVVHGTLGLLVALVGLTLAIDVVRDGTFPLWWRLLPPEERSASVSATVVDTWGGAFGVAALGLLWIPVTLLVAPVLAALQAWPGQRLLAPSAPDLALRVAELGATRAAALEAHAAELRRIERSLHDGAQNRLIAVTVMLAALQRALDRGDTDTAVLAVERARQAGEEALTELRALVRDILPPVLEQHSLAEALTDAAGTCAVPCEVEVGTMPRLPASVEATAWFVAAEALTNLARHSGATRARLEAATVAGRLRLRISDDGVGGADPARGTGLDGARRRIEAHDGRFAVTSPPGGPTVVEVSIPCGS